MLPSATLGFPFRQANASPPQVPVVSAFQVSILGGTVSLSLNFLVLSHHHLLETLNTCCCKPTRRGLNPFYTNTSMIG
ncbi:hypothetical protein SLE2022_235470 [Rubroshorea leprosula]